MDLLHRLLDNLFDFRRETTAGELIFYKVFEAFVGLGTVYLAWTWAQYIPRIGDVVLPLGIAQYLDVSFMFNAVAPRVNAACITMLALMGFFRLGRFGYGGAFLLLCLQYAARYTLGEIPHSANVLGMTLLGLALAPLAFRDARGRRRFVMGFTYFFIGLGYVLAGCSKLVASGPLWVDGRHLWMWINEKAIDAFSRSGVLEFNALQEAALSSYALATLFLVVGLVTELFAWLMWWRRTRYVAVWAVIGLHVGIYLVMDIMFYLSTIELVLLGLPWAALLDRLIAQRAARPALRPLQAMSARFA